MQGHPFSDNKLIPNFMLGVSTLYLSSFMSNESFHKFCLLCLNGLVYFSTIFILMDYPIHIDMISIDLSILYFNGL